MKYCSVMGCGRRADHINVPNPFQLGLKFNFCNRCLAAGKEATSQGEKELTLEILKKHYAQYPGR